MKHPYMHHFAKAEFLFAKPFPHLVIDDWLPTEEYQTILGKLKYATAEPALTFNTALEKNKSAFNLNTPIGAALNHVVAKLTSAEWLDELRWLSDYSSLIPLTDLQTPDTQYKYIHQSAPGGFLGSHVDHSQVYNSKGYVTNRWRVHTLNCIYYVAGAGSTQLFGPWGWGKPLAEIEARPNRLLIFKHDSRAFHGGGLVLEPRTTIYMDYYASVNEIEMANHWKHATTFVPRDVKSLRRYLPAYFKWLLRRPLI